MDAMRDFVRLMETQFGRPPKIIRSDQGGDCSAELVKFLKQEGIQQQLTTVCCAFRLTLDRSSEEE